MNLSIDKSEDMSENKLLRSLTKTASTNMFFYFE